MPGPHKLKKEEDCKYEAEITLGSGLNFVFVYAATVDDRQYIHGPNISLSGSIKQGQQINHGLIRI
jgi:hypothetical protein